MSGLWDELVAAAVIGTDRRPFAGAGADPGLLGAAPGLPGEPGLPGALGDAVRAAPDLLAAATVVWAHAEAGRRAVPGPVDSSGEPVDDQRPWVPSGALRALGTIINDRRFRPVLDEWLDLAVRSGGRLPGEAVPALLQAVRQPQRSAARTVVGPLAGWLAARNPDWRWAAVPEGPATRSPGTPLTVPAGGVPVDDAPPLRAHADRQAVAALEAAPAEALPALLATRLGPWSAQLTDAALAALSRCLTGHGSGFLPVRQALPGLALVIDPSRADEASALIDTIDALPAKARQAAMASWAAPLHALAAVVQFRRSLHEEFS